MRLHSRSPSLHLHVFGVPRVVVRGHETRLPLQRAFALLAYLAFNAGPVPRAHLAAMLWPEADESRARTRLRRLRYRIEETLGVSIVSTEGDCLALDAPCIEIDALGLAQFARAAIAAATLDANMLLQTRQWVELARLLERVIDALGRQGDSATALDLAEAARASWPTRRSAQESRPWWSRPDSSATSRSRSSILPFAPSSTPWPIASG